MKIVIDNEEYCIPIDFGDVYFEATRRGMTRRCIDNPRINDIKRISKNWGIIYFKKASDATESKIHKEFLKRIDDDPIKRTDSYKNCSEFIDFALKTYEEKNTAKRFSKEELIDLYNKGYNAIKTVRDDEEVYFFRG